MASKTRMASIFGGHEDTVAECMIAEGKLTRVSVKDTKHAGAPTENEAGEKVKYSVIIPSHYLEEYDSRVQLAHEREEHHTKALGIHLYYHCRKCLEERPRDMTPSEWASLEVGATEVGLQVWCKRHGVNVVHVNFEGFKHPAVM